MYKWLNDGTGQLCKNVWEIAGFYWFYFCYCVRNKRLPYYPGKWKYNKKGWC